MPATSRFRFAAGLARRPSVVAGRGQALATEMARVALGKSQVAPNTRDKRFADPAWSDNPALRRLLQAYLVTADTAAELVDDPSLPPADRERVRAAVSNLMDASAPSNNPLLNPEVFNAAVDTGGANFVRGLRHFVRDMSATPAGVSTPTAGPSWTPWMRQVASPQHPARRCSACVRVAC
jgi:polyhydroxyalkanoate synthase